MNNEALMWLKQFHHANPGWSVALGRDLQLGAGNLATDSYVYVVDTSTGWITAAALAQAELKRIAAYADANADVRQQALSACGSAIVDAGSRNVSHDSADAQACLCLAVCALAQTQVWEIIKQRSSGSLAGHWIYATYRLREGAGIIGRPGFVRRPKPGLIPPENLRRVIASMIAQDVGSPASAVGRDLAAGGGAVLSTLFDPAAAQPCDEPAAAPDQPPRG
jgi:hypothetical protein